MGITIAEMNSPVAENISKIIREKGLKQQHVARICGISDGDMSRMLNGRAVIKCRQIRQIADCLGVHPGSLFEEAPPGEVLANNPGGTQ